MSFEVLFLIIVAPFVGSFLGVAVARLPARRSVIFGRSTCPECHHTLAAVDLIPILSWLLLRGRCRYCNRDIGAFYPAMELAATALAIWAAFIVSGWVFSATCVLGWMLVALAAIDQRQFVLPDELTLPLIPLGLLVSGLIASENLLPHSIGTAAGFLVFAAVAWAYGRLRGRKGLGFGDAKLLAAAGAWVSWTGLPSVVLWASASALVFALVRARLHGRISLEQRLAFGPHLCLGLWIVWLYGPLLPS